MNAIAENSLWGNYIVRNKGETKPIDWDYVRQVVTFNSTVGVEALRRGIPVISDPAHSSIGSYTRAINALDNFDREPLFSFLNGHQFKLCERERIWGLVNHYISSSAGMTENLSRQKSAPIPSSSAQAPT